MSKQDAAITYPCTPEGLPRCAGRTKNSPPKKVNSIFFQLLFFNIHIYIYLPREWRKRGNGSSLRPSRAWPRHFEAREEEFGLAFVHSSFHPDPSREGGGGIEFLSKRHCEWTTVARKLSTPQDGTRRKSVNSKLFSFRSIINRKHCVWVSGRVCLI